MASRSIKRIMIDYKEILKDPLDGIYYTHDETNSTRGYALIIGPEGTPYEFGYYMFDFTFPDNYPFSPPTVKFVTYDGFTRFNPNLYINGRVCLSILNTWSGEKWSSCQSIRSVLLTLRTLILNDTPLLNEPEVTKEHRDYENYNTLIEYKNVEIAILKYLDKTNLPYEFHSFYPIMVECFLKHYEYFLEKFKDRQQKLINMYLYNTQMIGLNYKNLVRCIEIVAKELKGTKGTTF
jgi:ubiquitin-protein ligase